MIAFYLTAIKTDEDKKLFCDVYSEYTYKDTITIGDYSAELYTSIADRQKSMLLWYDIEEKTCFVLTSKIDVDELIKIAESVHLVE